MDKQHLNPVIELMLAYARQLENTILVSDANTEGETNMAKPTTNEQKVLEALREVAGAQFQESDIKFKGTELVLPAKWTTQRAIDTITEYQYAQEEITSFNRRYMYRPFDGAAATERAIRIATGMSGIAVGEMSFFGKTPPARMTIDVGLNQRIDVPWGTVRVPLFDGTIRIDSYKHAEYGQLFTLVAETPKRFKAEVNGFFDLVQQELERASIYKGKAFTGGEEPEFIDLSVVDPKQVIYSDVVMAQLEAHLWGILDYADAMRNNGVSLKRSVLLHGPYGCIQGDAEMVVNRAGKTMRMSLRDLVYKVNGGESRGRVWDVAIPTMVQRRDDTGAVRLVEIANAWESGVKTTYTVTTESGRTVRATDEHPFLTTDGWKRLDELVAGSSTVLVNGGRSHNGRADKKHYAVEVVRHHPHRRGNNAVDTHRLVAEADRNDIEFDDYVKRLKVGDIGDLVFIDPSKYAVHHIDLNHLNNSLENLRVLTHREHHQLHAELGTKNNVLEQTVGELVVSVELFGEEMTFDIEVVDEPHCFIAGGFVVHNTGKTLGGILTAQKAVENEFTFIMCRPGKDNPFDVLQTAQLYAPSVVFIEDIDTYSRSIGMGHDTMSELLDKFDGVGAKGREVIVCMTTNHEEQITKGMLRPGRLDALIEIAELDRNGVMRMVQSLVDESSLDEIDYDVVYDAMEGYLPAFVAEAVTRAKNASIVRGHGELLPLNTADIVNGAMSLRAQFELMQRADEVTVPPTLDTVFTDVIRKAANSGVDGMELYSAYEEDVTHVIQN